MWKVVRNIIEKDYEKEQKYLEDVKNKRPYTKNNIMATYFLNTSLEWLFLLVALYYPMSNIQTKVAEKIGESNSMIVSFMLIGMCILITMRQVKILIDIMFKYTKLRDEVLASKEESDKTNSSDLKG